MGKREDTYDAEIAPLMTRIIEICKASDIPIFASFQINDARPAEDPYHCTTAILPPDSAPALKAAYVAVLPQRGAAFTITTYDADGHPKRIERILP